MATTKLRLRPDRRNRNGKLGIYIQVCIAGKVKLFSTGLSIESEFWDDKKGKIKRIPGSNEHVQLNLLLEKKHQEIKEIIFQKTVSGETLSFDTISRELAPKDSIPTNFKPLFQRFCESKSLEYGSSTKKNYTVLFNQINEFTKGKDFPIKHLDFKFYEEFKTWLLKAKGHKNDTINKRLKTLKTFLRYCGNFEVFDVRQLEKFKMLESKPTTKIALRKDELEKLWAYDFSNNKRLERVRDLFVFACATGLRESDVRNLKQANISNDTIRINSIKTGTELEIPLNTYSKSILERYEFKLPKISQQKLNTYLKEVGRLVGLDDQEIVVSFQAGKRSEVTVPRYELLVSHVGRRSFVTINILKGVPIPVIQSMTGHKDLASFQKYIKISESDKRAAMEKW